MTQAMYPTTIDGCFHALRDQLNEIHEMRKRLSRLEGHVIDGTLPKPETWRDVTAECEQMDRSLIMRSPGCRTQIAYGIMDGYRLRKVRLNVGYCSTEHQDAFIVEKREP